MYNNNNDNKCGAIVYTICAYVYTQQDTYANLPTHRQAGWLDRAREDSVRTHIMRHIAHHNITHTYTHIYIHIHIYHNTYYLYTHTIVGSSGR